MLNPFKLIGAAGLLLISLGIITKARKTQNVLYIIGGVCLEIYSIYLGDIIFITLQIIFIAAALYDFIKIQFFQKKQCRSSLLTLILGIFCRHRK